MADTATETPLAPLNVNIEEVGPARKLVTVELTADQVAEKVTGNFDKLRDDAAVPGFRKGRAPMRLLRKKFGSAVRDDAKSQLISETYQRVIDEHKLEVLGQPEFKDAEKIELPESGPMTFAFEVEVNPSFELPSLEGLSLTRPKLEVTDEKVQSEIDQYAKRQGQMVKLDDATIDEDDFVDVDASIFAGDNAGDDAELIQHEPHQYAWVAGESREYRGHVAGIVVEDLGKQLKGKKPGDELTISMTGPESHENEKIKGQPITLKLKLGQVQRIEPAKIEDMAKALGLEDETKLRERVRESLTQRNVREQQQKLRDQAIEQLTEAVEMELPAGISGRQTQRMLDRVRMEVMYQGKTQEEAEQAVAERRSESEASAAKELKQFFILDRAAKALDVQVNEQEINGQIAMMAMEQNRRPEKMRQELMRDGRIEQLYLQVREQKTLDAIIAKATVTDEA